MTRGWSWTVFVSALVALVLTTRAASGHTLGLSSGEYRVVSTEHPGVAARLSFAAADGLRLAPGLDADGDRRVSASEVARAKVDLGRVLGAGILVVGDGQPCTARLTDAALTEGDGLLFELSYDCGELPREIDLALPLLADLGATHRHVARTIGEATADVLLSSESSRVSFRTGAPAPGPRDASGDAGVSTGHRAPAPGPATLGFRHVLGAWDHLLVLAALALLPWARGARFGAVVAFTLGHTAASALAARGLVAASPRLLEALVGVGLAGLGLVVFEARRVEALARPSRGGWTAGLPLGFLHGLAFSAMPVSSSASTAPSTLLAFGAGVLMAQLSIGLPASWLVRYARSEGSLSARARGWMGLGLVAAGLVATLRALAA